MKTKVRHVRAWTMVLSGFVAVALIGMAWHKLASVPSGPLEARFVDRPRMDLEKAQRGVVSLWVVRNAEHGAQLRSMIGCGLVVDPRGYVLTSVALPPETRRLYVMGTDEVEYESDLVITDSRTQLSLLKVLSDGTADRPFEVAAMGDSGQAERGDHVAVLGARMEPIGWRLTTTAGRITDGRQNLRIGKRRYRDLIQTDVDLTSEHAGGPLVNQNAEMIGLALRSVHPPGDTEFSYAVPISQAKSFLDSLPIPRWTDGPGGQVSSWLGAETIPLNPVMATQFELGRRRGEVVNRIANNSPAERAGLRRGDVITTVNDEPIANRQAFDAIAPQLCTLDSIELTVLRDGHPKSLTVAWDQGGYVRPGRGSLAEVVLVVLVFTLMYVFVYRNLLDRVVLFVLGAIVVALLGHHLGFYDQYQVAAALLSKIDVLCFIVGMHLICGVLEEAGMMEWLAKRMTLATGGNAWRIMALFCVVTYLTSMVVNNLTTIIIMAPMVLKLSKYLDCDVKPFLISMIIASNLGGASTMVGDFPNMLIGAEIGLPFRQFIYYMLPICLLELLVLLVYLRFARRDLFARPSGDRIPRQAVSSRRSSSDDEYEDCRSWMTDRPELADPPDGSGRGEFFHTIRQSLDKTVTNRTAAQRGLVILAAVTIAFLLSERLNCRPAIIALAGGIVALAFGACNPFTLMRKVGIRNILFFSGLFVLVGAAEAAGTLDYVSKFIIGLSSGNTLVLTLLLMWAAACVTCFLNAGPATALFLPVVLSFGSAAPHHLYWWGLSLGVCAGSSGTLAGATSGNVAATMLEGFLKNEDVAKDPSAEPEGTDPDGHGKLTFHEYARLGVPLMLIFLLISSMYVVIIYSV